MRYLSLLLIAGVALSGCATSNEQVIRTGERYTAPAEGTTADDYRLDVGDKIRLTVFNEPSVSGDFAINPNGAVALPLIGDVPARGKTAREVAAAAQDRFGRGYLREPKVSVEITGFRPFFILGEVKSPGQYPSTNGMTVLNAVATAQGFTPRARKSTVYIRRSGEATEQLYEVTPDLRIYPGDTVRFAERYF